MDASSGLYTVLDAVCINIYSCLLPSELHALALTSHHLSKEVPRHLTRTCIEVFRKSVGYSVEDKNGNHFSVEFAPGNAIQSKGDVVASHLKHIHRDGLRICNTESKEESMEKATSLLRENNNCFLPFTHPECNENVMVSPEYIFNEDYGKVSPQKALSQMWICKCKVKRSRDFVRRAWVYRHLGINKNQENTFTRLDLIRAWVYCLLGLKQNRIVAKSSFDVTWKALNLNNSEHDAVELYSYRERTDSFLIQSELGDTITLEQYQLRV